MSIAGVDIFGIKRRRRRRETWARVAAELGGTFHLARGFWRRTTERIEAIVAGVPVVLDIYVVSTGKSQQVFTRVTASYVRGPGPKLRVYRHGVLAAIGKALGMDDVELGARAEFDDAFFVRSSNAAVARRLWTAAAIDLMLAHFDKGTITSTPTEIKLVTQGIWEEAKKLHAGIALIRELASRDLYGIEALQAIDGAAVTRSEQGWPRAELAAPVRVVIQAEHPGPQLVMVARATERFAVDPFELEVVDGAMRDAERASWLPPGAHVAVRTVGSGRLASDGAGLRFTWRELELDPARLRAGAELLGAIAVGRGGQYR